MRVSLANVAAVLMLLAVSRGSTAQTAPRAEDVQRVERLVATLTQEAATLCPLSDPGDQRALDRCRSALFNDSYFKRSLARFLLMRRPPTFPLFPYTKLSTCPCSRRFSPATTTRSS